MSKKSYPNLFQALKARDRLWSNKGQRLRAYRHTDGLYYLTSMGGDDYWNMVIKKSSEKECTEENLIKYIYRFQHSHGYYPTLSSAMNFFDASEELMEAFIEDCAVVVLGTTLIPLAEIEEIYMIHHPEEKKTNLMNCLSKWNLLITQRPFLKAGTLFLIRVSKKK